MGSLLVIGKWFVLSLALLSLAAWFTVVWVGRRHGLAAITAIGAVAALLTLTTAADVVNAHYRYLPRVDDVVGQKSWPTVSLREVADPGTRPTRPHHGGSVVAVPVAGTYSGFGTHTALVYLPPQYFTEPTRRFPVVYLLHGSPGVPVDWYRANEAAQIGAGLAAAGRPMILIAPQMSHDWLDDSECVDRPGEHIETYLINDVIPTIDNRLRTIDNRDDRTFAGMSAGGFCALNLGLRHRDLVGTIIDMSGFSQPTHSGGMAGLFGHRPDLAQVATANNPAQYASSLPANPPMRVWLDCGRSDHAALTDLRAMANVLRRPGYSTVLHLRPGGHDYGVWVPALRDGLTWA